MSSIYESSYSEMINNSIYHLSSLLLSGVNNGKSDCHDNKGSSA